MTDSEKFDLILLKLESMEQKIDSVEQRMDSMEQKINSVERRMDSMEQKIDSVEQKITGSSLHIENVTDKNIQLIAENYINLTNKLNQAIPAADKNLAYEVKVNYLVERVQILEKELKELKNRTA